MPGKKGQNLIFLISQVRAGSTLLQNILGNHPDIYTISEPWLMLSPLYTLRSTGSEAEYNAQWAWDARQAFFQQLPQGEEVYFEGVRRMATCIYESALSGSHKRYFLDKTPRYYHIIPELYHTFPDALFIILLRNPLAVLSSILTTWVKEDWLWLQMYTEDLLRAPVLLLDGIKILGERGVVVHYEQMLTNSLEAISPIFTKLGMQFLPNIIDYSDHSSSQAGYGFREQGDIYKTGKPNRQNLNKWLLHLQDPQIWRLIEEYLHILGSTTITQMGYSYDELLQSVHAYRPYPSKLFYTFSLQWLLQQTPPRKTPRYKHYLITTLRLSQRQGIPKTFLQLIWKTARRVIGLFHL